MTANNVLQQALEYVRNLHEPGHLSALIHQLRPLVGAANLAYQALFIPGRLANQHLIATTYSDQWNEFYLSKNYSRADPIEIALRRASQPVDWKLLRLTSKEAEAFFAAATRYGVGQNGVSIPLNNPRAGRALFSVTSNLEGDDWAVFKASALPSLIEIGRAIQLRSAEIKEQPRQPALTAKEIDYLALYVAGYEIKEIGDMHSVSGTAVRSVLNSATDKLEARGPRHAGYLAIALGIVPTSVVLRQSNRESEAS
jgi:DNA-binding CsgD family transcriptional regulator